MSANNELVKSAVLYYGVSILKRLRELARPQVQEAAQAAGNLSLREPLWQHPATDLVVPHFDKPLTGCQVIAVQVFGIWVLCGESEQIAGALIDAWPIRETVLLAS